MSKMSTGKRAVTSSTSSPSSGRLRRPSRQLSMSANVVNQMLGHHHQTSRVAFHDAIVKPRTDRKPEDIDIIASELRKLEAMGKFADELMPAVAQVAELVTYGKDKVVFEIGDQGTAFYVIASGSAAVAVPSRTDPKSETVVCCLFSGHGFGDVALINSKPRNATVRSRESSQFVRILKDDFLNIWKRQREIEEEAENATTKQASERGAAHGVKEPSARVSQLLTVPGGPTGSPKPGLKRVSSAVSVCSFEGDTADEAGSSKQDQSPNASMASIDSVLSSLRKEPTKRDAEDIANIFNDIMQLKSMFHLSASIRRQLAAVVVLVEVPNAEHIVFEQGDQGETWYVILRGSVDVVVNGVNVCTLREGDGFGELSVISNDPRSATIVTGEPGCQFVTVQANDYKRILKDLEEKTVRLMEHDKVTMIMERLSFGVGKEGYIVMAGTPEKLTEHLEKEHEADPKYLRDFLLTFRAFMEPSALWRHLMASFYYEPPVASTVDNVDHVLRNQRDRQAKVVVVIYEWMNCFIEDFDDDLELQENLIKFVESLRQEKLEDDLDQFLSEMEDAVKDDGQKATSEMMKNENQYQAQLRASFFRKLSELSVGLTSSDSLSRKSISAPNVTQELERIKVYLSDESYKTLAVLSNTPAREIIQLALEKFHVTDKSVKWNLCEVRSDGAVIVLADTDCSLGARLGLNSRYYLRHEGQVEIALPAKSFSVEQRVGQAFVELDVREVTRQLTLTDFEMYSKIDPTEYIYHIFKKGDGSRSVNLTAFSNRFNEIMYWVATEILVCSSMQKRALTIKRFIKLAICLRTVNNFNALFAILSGLANVAVSRLKLTWERVPAKYAGKLEELQSGMDPSRNMRNYRMMFSAAEPPMIPFFPVLMKDLTFIHEGNKSKQEGLVNYDKLRMIAKSVDQATKAQQTPYRREQLLIEEENGTIGALLGGKSFRNTLRAGRQKRVPPEMGEEAKRVRKSLAALHVLDDQRMLGRLSRDAEPPASSH